MSTQPERGPQEIARAVYLQTKDLVANLAIRWADEKEYEDIEEYKAVIAQTITEPGVVIVGMSKRPFGFLFTAGGYRFKMVALLKSDGVRLRLSYAEKKR